MDENTRPPEKPNALETSVPVGSPVQTATNRSSPIKMFSEERYCRTCGYKMTYLKPSYKCFNCGESA